MLVCTHIMFGRLFKEKYVLAKFLMYSFVGRWLLLIGEGCQQNDKTGLTRNQILQSKRDNRGAS